jgi:hypothetical protein
MQAFFACERPEWVRYYLSKTLELGKAGHRGVGTRRRRRPAQSWRTFLTNHVAALVSIDFFTVPTLTGRVLFVLVLLARHRRRIVHLAITEHSTAVWTAQQIIEAFPDDSAPRRLLRDRDAIYGDLFRRRVASMEHLCLAKDAPTPRRVQASEEGRVIAFPEVGGLDHPLRTTRSLTKLGHALRMPVTRSRRAGEPWAHRAVWCPSTIAILRPPALARVPTSPQTAAQRGFGEGQLRFVGGSRQSAL